VLVLVACGGLISISTGSGSSENDPRFFNCCAVIAQFHLKIPQDLVWKHYNTLLVLMINYMEAMHQNPFVWLVRKLIRNLVHLLDRSLVLQIETNVFPELDFQMHLHDLPKGRLQSAPRAL
jgi:hypothetical protein